MLHTALRCESAEYCTLLYSLSQPTPPHQTLNTYIMKKAAIFCFKLNTSYKFGASATRHIRTFGLTSAVIGGSIQLTSTHTTAAPSIGITPTLNLVKLDHLVPEDTHTPNDDHRSLFVLL